MKTGKQFLLTAAVLGALLGSGTLAYADSSLDPVYVEGWRTKEVTAGGYAATSQHMGILGNKAVMDTPFSQVNLTQKAFDAYSDPSQPTVSALLNVPSVRSSSSTLYNDMSIRGQGANSYQFRVNGIPSVFTQMNVGVDFVDRVDVTSGPAMAMNGSGKESPGGVINFVSKKATEDMVKVTTSFAGRSSVGVRVDASGRHGENREWGWRVNSEYVKGDAAVKKDYRSNKDIYLNLDHADKNSTTNLLIGYRDTYTEGGQRYFNIGSGAFTKMIKVPNAKHNYSFPGQSLGMRTYMALLNHEQRLSDHVVAFLNAGYAKNDGYRYYMSKSSRLNILNEAGDFKTELLNEPYEITNKYLQVGVRGDFMTGSIKHELTLAADQDRYEDAWGYTVRSHKSLDKNGKEVAGLEVLQGNIYTGSYAVTGYPVMAYAKKKSSKTTYGGFSVIDTMSKDNWQLMVGMNYQNTKVHSYSTNSDVESSATSPILGLVYHANDNWMLYASHAESYDKGTVVSRNYENGGTILPPAKMKANEFGVKYNKDGLLAGLAFFDMSRDSNIEVVEKTANGDKSFLRQNGETQYRGFEGSLHGSLNDKWSWTAGFMKMSAKQKHTTKGLMDGRKAPGVVDWSAVIGTEYHATDNLDIFGRMVYAGKASVYDVNNNELTIPSYTTFDLGARYRTALAGKPVTLQATIYNLFDKEYWLARPGTNYAILSNPRTFSLSATWEF